MSLGRLVEPILDKEFDHVLGHDSVGFKVAKLLTHKTPQSINLGETCHVIGAGNVPGKIASNANFLHSRNLGDVND